jgi:hypothetical protein
MFARPDQGDRQQRDRPPTAEAEQEQSDKELTLESAAAGF